MRLRELAERFSKDPRGTAPRLSVPVLVLERLGQGDAESWERTGALVVGSGPATSDPELFFVEKVPRTGNAFALGVTLGRTDSNDIIIDDASVSRFHAWLQHDAKQGWLLCDAKSKNGLQFDGEDVPAGGKVALHDGALIKVGQAALRFLMPQTLVELLKASAPRA